MELIFSMRRKPFKNEPPRLESGVDGIRPLCIISTANIIAFSSSTELNDVEGDSWGGHVYVCDLDTPWAYHHVTSTIHPVSALEWEWEGRLLLVATSAGDVSVFGPKDHLLNQWTCLYTDSFKGEHVLRASFFHPGRRILVADKKPEQTLSTERYQLHRSTPTVRGFGGVGCDGVCVVTATGLWGAILPPMQEPSSSSTSTSAPNTPKAINITESLCAARQHIVAADIAHKNGNLLVAVVCDSRPRCVRTYLASLRLAPPPGHKLLMAMQPLPSLYLPDEPHAISMVSWCLREDPDLLLVGGATLTLWKLSERALPVHKLLAKSPPTSVTPGAVQKPHQECFNTVVWQQAAAWSWEGGGGSVCSALASCKLPPPVAPCAVIAQHNILHLLWRDKLAHVCSVAVVTDGAVSAGSSGTGDNSASEGNTPPKKAKYGTSSITNALDMASITCLDMSWLGGVLVAIDTYSQLHVYKLPQPAADIPTPLSIQHAATLLEYSLVSGYDSLDVLMTLKSNAIEVIYERITECFQRQPAIFQQYYHMNWLTLRAALSRLQQGSQSRASDLTSLQMLHATWAALEGLLRPSEQGAHDKSPGEALQAAIEDPNPPGDIDKAVLLLDGKELGSEAGSAQALRRLVQRTVDTALSMLAALPMHVRAALPPTHQSYELWCDPTSLSLMRRVLVVARAWGLARGALQGPPTGVYVLDAPALLYRLLTRLATSVSSTPGNTAPGPPQDILEECSLIAAQAPIPRVCEVPQRCCLAALHSRHPPYHLEYGVEPEHLKCTAEPSSGDTILSDDMDCIRYIYLGVGVSKWRSCSRCGAKAHALPYCTRHTTQRAYDARYIQSCRCGGRWTLSTNT